MRAEAARPLQLKSTSEGEEEQVLVVKHQLA
jgi:hypothetical protein